MSSIVRHIKRQSKPHYSCCGQPMTYNLFKGGYVCSKCGKIKKEKKER